MLTTQFLQHVWRFQIGIICDSYGLQTPTECKRQQFDYVYLFFLIAR